MTTYSGKLKDPRWQKKRLEILERDNWECQICGDNESTLIVHHYKYSGEPWEVEDKYLKTLCEDCHDSEHQCMKEQKELLTEAMSEFESDIYRAVAHIVHLVNIKSKYPPGISFDILETCLSRFDDFFNENIAKFYFDVLKAERKSREVVNNGDSQNVQQNNN